MMLNLLTGIIGMSLVLIVFILDEFETKYNEKTVVNNLLSVVGAGLLIYYGIVIKGWPFVALNIIWLTVAVVKLVNILKRS